jgi:hypothetical protein
MKTLILRAEYLPLEEKVDDYYVTNSNMQEVFFTTTSWRNFQPSPCWQPSFVAILRTTC